MIRTDPEVQSDVRVSKVRAEIEYTNYEHLVLALLREELGLHPDSPTEGMLCGSTRLRGLILDAFAQHEATLGERLVVVGDLLRRAGAEICRLEQRGES